MSKMQVAFETELQHGCIVLRDTESEGDISDWDPSERAWFVDRGSAIFAVLPGVDGQVRCEVWRGSPDSPLPHRLFEETFVISGAFQATDPAGVVSVELATIRGAHQVEVLVDDLEWAGHVQVVVDPDGR